MAETLHDILANAGISTARLQLRPGGSEKTTCPVCRGGNSPKEPSLSVSVDADGMGVTWNCKRGNCSGFKGGDKIRTDRPMPPAKAKDPPKPAKHYDASARKQPDALYHWAAGRGFSRETVDAFGLFVATVYIPQVKAERPAIAFPYVWKGEVVAHKYRDAEKNHTQDPGTVSTLFNIDSLESDDIAYAVEGEPDVLAMWEAGYRQVVTLRDGADNRLLDEDDPRRQDDKRFAALALHAERVKGIKRWIIATDGDGPGNNVAEEWARRIGKARCARVHWPDGCKDANDVLRQHGPERLRQVIEAAKPWPIKGLVLIEAERALQHRARGRVLRGIETGIAAMDDAFKMPIEGGRLIVVTGPPNHGKSPLVRQVMVRLAHFHDCRFVVAAPEEGSVDVLVEQLTALRGGAPFWPGPTRHMEDAELRAATAWVAEHFAFVSCDDPDDELTIDYTLERAEAAKMAIGARYLFVDPWNEFEHILQRGESETQMTSRILKRLKAWGRLHGFDIIIVAHPQKPSAEERRKPRAPDGYDIAGSANWHNKADLGLTVWRPTGEETTEIKVWKSKNMAWGKRGNSGLLAYDVATGRYRSADRLKMDRRAELAAREDPADAF